MKSLYTHVLVATVCIVAALPEPVSAQTTELDHRSSTIAEIEASLDAIRRDMAKLEGQLAQIKASVPPVAGEPMPAAEVATSPPASMSLIQAIDAKLATQQAKEPRDEPVSLGATPVFGFTSGSEGDYAKLGARLNVKRWIASDAQSRPGLLTVEVAGLVETDENRGAELARFTPDDSSWGNDLALKADLRMSWYDQPDQTKLAVVRQLCSAAPGSPKCRTENDLSAWLDRATADDLKKLASDLKGIDSGLDKDGKPLPAEYLVGIEGQYGWQKESFFEAGTLPLTADDEAPRSERYNPFHVKGYAGLSIFTDPAVWNLTAVGSVGWRRRYAYPANTENQQVCLASPSRGYTTCKPFNLSAPFRAEGVTTGLGLNLLSRKFSSLGQLRAAAFWKREFALERSTFIGEFAFALGEKGEVSSGLRYTHLTEGFDPFGNLLKRVGSLTVFLSTDFQYPAIP